VARGARERDRKAHDGLEVRDLARTVLGRELRDGVPVAVHLPRRGERGARRAVCGAHERKHLPAGELVDGVPELEVERVERAVEAPDERVPLRLLVRRRDRQVRVRR
jgi:hypothetical protein